jgi:hypothetical protein
MCTYLQYFCGNYKSSCANGIMNTNELSLKVYQAILLAAEHAHKDLALQFGMLAKLSNNEADYISKSKQLIALMQSYDADEVDAIFVESPLSMEAFNDALQLIANNIFKL